MKRLVYLLTVLSILVLLVFVAAAGAQQQEAQQQEAQQEEETAQDEVVVSIQDGYFDPAHIVVAPGTTVRWVNEGEKPHNVTADDGLFDSGTLYPGDSYWVTFEGRGMVNYHCSPQMTGSVTVA